MGNKSRRLPQTVAVIFCLVAMATMVMAATAWAEYPDKPISYIISFNPGGESDVTARLQLAQILARSREYDDSKALLEEVLGNSAAHYP